MAGHSFGSTGHGVYHGRSRRRLGRPPTPVQRAERAAREAWARQQPCSQCGSRQGVALRYDTGTHAMEPLCGTCDAAQGAPF